MQKEFDSRLQLNALESRFDLLLTSKKRFLTSQPTSIHSRNFDICISHICLLARNKTLVFSENDEMNAKDDSPSYPPERPPMHSTYKMPPLTPTVANLIHTSSVVKKSYSHLGSSSKVMKPGEVDS